MQYLDKNVTDDNGWENHKEWLKDFIDQNETMWGRELCDRYKEVVDENTEPMKQDYLPIMKNWISTIEPINNEQKKLWMGMESPAIRKLDKKQRNKKGCAL